MVEVDKKRRNRGRPNAASTVSSAAAEKTPAPLRSGAAALFLISLAAAFHFVSRNIPDPDAFYYAGLAGAYYERGLSDPSFPWTHYSVVRELSSSLWYGFGVFMIPFTLASDGAAAIKVAGVLLTSGVLLGLYVVAKRHGFVAPLAWPLVFFFCSPNVQYQLLMTRPQLFSIALGLVLFSFLVRPPQNAPFHPFGRSAPIFFATLALTWLHLNFVWLPLLVCAGAVVARLALERRWESSAVVAVFAGAAGAWLARPEPVNAAKLFRVQLVEQSLARESLNLLLGTENLPLATAALSTTFLPLTLIYALATAGAARSLLLGKDARIEQRVFLLAGLLLSAAFFIVAISSTRRAYNLWGAFTVLLAGAVFSDLQRSRRKLGVLLGALLCLLALRSSTSTLASLRATAAPPDRLRAPALWLKENSQPGEIVFNVRWSDFGPLFFWNRKNYYVGGLDPVFQYAYDRKRYWKYHHLALDLSAEFTCAAPLCTPETAEDIHTVLARDFKARYVLVSRRHNPLLASFLDGDGRFERAFSDGNDLVFRLK